MAKWADILQIERTGYYAWLRNREALEDHTAYLKKRIKEEFDESRGTYGPDRIAAELAKNVNTSAARNALNIWLI